MKRSGSDAEVPISKLIRLAEASTVESPNCGHDDDDDDDDPTNPKVVGIGGPVIKSPLDGHQYKTVLHPRNGLKGLLVSTCAPKVLDKGKTSSKTCVFTKISEFNETYVNFKTTTGQAPGGEANENRYKFSKASQKQENQSKLKRKKKEPPAKCRTGVHEQDDEIQTFCNNMFVGVLYVKAGFHQDPREVQGMAHLVEHVLTLSRSKNYPEVEGFTKFVEGENGYFNAYTQHENTVYVFYVDYKQIDKALDMFGDMFGNNIFQRKDVAKEVNMVASEFESTKKFHDGLRQFAILKSCVEEGHCAGGFGVGSRDSLNRDMKVLMAEVHEWIEKYYFAENMFFALQGPRPMAELEKLFSNLAEKLPGRTDRTVLTRQLSCSTDHTQVPFNMKKWNKLYHIDAPTSTFMSVSWVLDPKYGKNYETNPVYYFDYIFQHKEPGSLDWYLKGKGWIRSMGVNDWGESSFYSTDYYTAFCIYIELTSNGLNERIQVLQTIFLYMKLLQEKKACEEIFNEIRQLKADIFHYRSDMNLSDPTFGLHFDGRTAPEMLNTLLHIMSKTRTTEDILLSSFLMRKFDAPLLDEFVNCLTPSKALVIFGHNSFALAAKETEKWYQMKYFAKPMCEKFIANVLKHPPIPELSFPRPNPYISVSFCYPDENSRESRDKMEFKNDLLAYETEKGAVIYGNAKCRRGMLPSASYAITFESPAIEDATSVTTFPCLEVFQTLLEYILDVKLGPALSSLISYNLVYEPGYMTVFLNGPSPKLPQLAKIVLSTVENFEQEVQNRTATTALEDSIRVNIESYKARLNDPEDCSLELLKYVITHRRHVLTDYMPILESSLDEDDLLSFVQDFKRTLFISGELDGCVSKRHADEVAEFVNSFQCLPYSKKLENKIKQHAIQLPVGERCLRVLAKNRQDGNVTVRNYYQFGHLRGDEAIMFDGILEYINEHSFEELRTKQNLGYTAYTGYMSVGGVSGIFVFVVGEADKYTCGYIDDKIDDFMQTAFDNGLSTPQKFKNNILNRLDGESVTYTATRNFFMNYLLPTGNNFRKISIQIQGYKQKLRSKPEEPLSGRLNQKIQKYKSSKKLVRCGPNGKSCGLSRYYTYLDMDFRGVTEENGYFITDVKSFKDQMPCYPVLGYNSSSDEEDDE